MGKNSNKPTNKIDIGKDNKTIGSNVGSGNLTARDIAGGHIFQGGEHHHHTVQIQVTFPS